MTSGVTLAWTGGWEPFAYWSCGLPTWREHAVPPRLGLATKRQLRALGLTPNQRPCARLELDGDQDGATVRWAWLYRIELARPRVEQTPGRRAGWEAAMRGRRTCRVPEHVGPRDVGKCIRRRALGGCDACHAAGLCRGTWDDLDEQHDVAA